MCLQFILFHFSDSAVATCTLRHLLYIVYDLLENVHIEQSSKLCAKLQNCEDFCSVKCQIECKKRQFFAVYYQCMLLKEDSVTWYFHVIVCNVNFFQLWSITMMHCFILRLRNNISDTFVYNFNGSVSVLLRVFYFYGRLLHLWMFYRVLNGFFLINMLSCCFTVYKACPWLSILW